ncbi:f-box domain-containing protein [Gigaspora margarita]|uniref:F-box domain-containing protein n=1 Tax=Gigaspora margarita TaxID=4874 RepID=A0A8H4A034_GIGMA|nr:f-box domain-containing protein [Gigaspora margarita]
MINLPNECILKIFDNFKTDYKCLYSCLLVNRHWCRITVPLLWREPMNFLGDKRLIEVFLLTLNSEEQSLLSPFKLLLPNYSKPLLEYTSYIISVNNHLYDGIENWLRHEGYYDKKYVIVSDIEDAIKCSLILMFLRTNKKLKYLSLNGIICYKLIFENLYKNDTIISMDYHFNNDFKSSEIDALIKILSKSTTLTSLNLSNNQLGSDNGTGKEIVFHNQLRYKKESKNNQFVSKNETEYINQFGSKDETKEYIIFHDQVGSENELEKKDIDINPLILYNNRVDW